MENKQNPPENWKQKYEQSQAQIAVIQKHNAEIQEKVATLEKLVRYYEEAFRLYQHQRFGVSSQKSPIPDTKLLTAPSR